MIFVGLGCTGAGVGFVGPSLPQVISVTEEKNSRRTDAICKTRHERMQRIRFIDENCEKDDMSAARYWRVMYHVLSFNYTRHGVAYTQTT